MLLKTEIFNIFENCISYNAWTSTSKVAVAAAAVPDSVSKQSQRMGNIYILRNKIPTPEHKWNIKKCEEARNGLS